MATRVILFDLDGTLWRGYEWYASVLSEVIGLDEATTMEQFYAGKNVFSASQRGSDLEVTTDYGLPLQGQLIDDVRWGTVQPSEAFGGRL